MSVRTALGFSFLDRYSGLVLSIGSSMILARLLTPAEIGVFSVTMVFLVFITALRDMGAGQYLVQERELDAQKIRAAWTVSLGTGCVAGLIVLALAVPVSRFYEEPRMVPIMLLIALNFVINPFGSLTYAWLIREMRFEALASMRFLSGLAGAVVSLWLACRGHGPISLAYGSLATTLVNGAVAAFHRPREFPLRPGRYGLRAVLDKGSRFSGNGLVSVVGTAAPELILGKIDSLVAAALYSRASGLCTMFQRLVLDATQVVAISMFAKEARENQHVAQSFVRSVAYVSVLGWSFFLALALLAHPSIRFLYGDQWDGAVTVTRLMAVASLVAMPAAMCPAVLLGLGEAGLILKTTAVATLTQVVAISVGAFTHGIEGVAIGLALANALTTPLWLRRALRHAGCAWADLRSVFARSAAVAATTSLGPALAVWVFGWEPENNVYCLLLAASAGAALFVIGLLLWRHPLGDEITRLLGRINTGSQT